MSKSRTQKYLNYRNFIKNSMLITGLWPVENPNLVYRFLPYFETAISSFMAIFIFGFVLAHSNNIALIIKGLSIMTGFLTVTMKIVCILIYRKEMHILYRQLDNHFKELIGNSKLNQAVLENLPGFKGITTIFIISVAYSCSSWMLLPLYNNIRQYINQAPGVQYKLLYPTGYPWIVPQNGYLFQLHFIFESLAAAYLCLITLSVDPLFAFFVFQMIGQLREISYNMSLVKESNYNGIILRKCVIQYQKLMKCRDIIQKVYGPVILWTMATNAVILCTVMFQITHTKNISKGRMGLLATWISLKLLQTYLYAWSGSKLTEESKKHETAIYSAQWYGNKNLMSSILIMLIQRPLYLTACNFSIVSLDIFVMILNTTMSYFFMLQALETET